LKNSAAPGSGTPACGCNGNKIPGVPRYRSFDHDAGVGIIGCGHTLEEANLELALVRCLHPLLATAREQGMALSRYRIERDGVLRRGVAFLRPRICIKG
jgi:hypothetical protein